MITTYTKNGYPVISLNKNATEFVVYECLDCSNKMYIEQGVDGYRCDKCGGCIDPIDICTRKD